VSRAIRLSLASRLKIALEAIQRSGRSYYYECATSNATLRGVLRAYIRESNPITMTQITHPPFYISDLDALRRKLVNAERGKTQIGLAWSSMRRRAKAAPESFPWLTPFIALVTGDPADIESAKAVIRRYVARLEGDPFGMGLQFHFWCYAFPHARWVLYFQWLESIGAWEAAEADRIRAKLIEHQYLYFFSGMRTKPDPECVDNQTMSLCFSSALTGYLYGRAPYDSAICRRMYAEGAPRLPSVIGGMPPSGYSGEGSTYMDGVVGPAVPYLVEFLERTQGGDWYDRPLEPCGGSAASVARMLAREWMPGGLMLPWDHYGYSHPVRTIMAYAARRTGDPTYIKLLEEHANWSLEVGVGWGYDDSVWALIWWPDDTSHSDVRAFKSWSEPDIGAVLTSDDSDLYLMQMWDRTEPHMPVRQHVNPNAVLLNAYGIPLSADGTAAKTCTAFNYDDTWRVVAGMDYDPVKYNYGYGCGGAHSVLLVDGWESLRALGEYTQATLVSYDAAGKSVIGDATPIYQEKCPDVRTMRRRSRLCEERFWLVEDLTLFAGEHDVTARWLVRPEQVESTSGFAIRTAEGVRLTLIPVLGPAKFNVRSVEGFPDRLDGGSLMVDYAAKGAECRWLWVAFPQNTRRVVADVSDDWSVWAQPAGAEADFAAADSALKQSDLTLPFTQPAFDLADLPLSREWWYRRDITRPTRGGKWWIQLPLNMQAARVFIDGNELDIAKFELSSKLIEPRIPLPENGAETVTVTVYCEASISQLDGVVSGFWGRPVVWVEEAVAEISAEYDGKLVIVRCGDQEWQVAHELMGKE